MKKLFKILITFIISIFKKPVEKQIEEVKEPEIVIEEKNNILIKKHYKAARNKNKCFASTKSFNNRNNKFVPEKKQLKSKSLYSLLSHYNKLPLIKDVEISFKKWSENRFKTVKA